MRHNAGHSNPHFSRLDLFLFKNAKYNLYMSFQFTSSGTMKLAQFTTETCLNFMNFVGMIVQRTLGIKFTITKITM